MPLYLASEANALVFQVSLTPSEMFVLFPNPGSCQLLTYTNRLLVPLAMVLARSVLPYITQVFKSQYPSTPLLEYQTYTFSCLSTLTIFHSYKTCQLTGLQTVSGTTQGVSDVTKGAGNTVRDGAGNLSGQNKQTAENPLGLSEDK